jgi:anaerobic selenocysteine-containing dehydrogenase
MADFTPPKVEAQTGIPAAKIEQLARELVAVRPSVIVVDEGMCDHETVSAALVVNAILGSIDTPGGMLLGAEDGLSNLGSAILDDTARAGLQLPSIDGREQSQRDFESSRILALPEAILLGKPYPVKVLLCSYSNPAYSKPGGRLWREATAKIPFVASFSPLLDESTLFADLLLPDPTFFERWDIVAPGRGSRVLSIRQPVVQPLADTLQTGEVILRVARALGATVAATFPWAGYRQAVLARLEMLDGGADAVLGEIESKGAWTPSEGPSQLVLSDVRGIAERPVAPPAGDPSRFPFVLVPFRGPGYAEGGMRQVPWLRELPLSNGNPWPERVEISVEDARKLGVKGGERIVVESPEAKVELWVVVRAGIRPGVLALPLGAGPGPAVDAAPSARILLSSLVDKDSGHWFACATRAQVRKVT